MPINTEKNKNILNEIKNDAPDTDKLVINPKEALIFSCSEEIKKRFTRFVYECFELSAYAVQDKDLLKSELYFVPYHTILLDVDSIFFELNEILRFIHDKGSKNKESKIYLITSNKENVSKLRKIKLHKRIILLMNGEEIVYLIGGRKFLPKTSINSSEEK